MFKNVQNVTSKMLHLSIWVHQSPIYIENYSNFVEFGDIDLFIHSCSEEQANEISQYLNNYLFMLTSS